MGRGDFRDSEYPTCPNNSDHGICNEAIIQSSCLQGTEPLMFSIFCTTVINSYSQRLVDLCTRGAHGTRCLNVQSVQDLVLCWGLCSPVSTDLDL